MLKRERLALQAAYKIHKSGTTTEERLKAGFAEMLELGGLYVKFAQLLLLNQSFSRTVPAELRRAVFDRVDTNNKLTKLNYFSHLDLQKLSDHGVQMEDSPSYAGSFAAVFDGRMGNKNIVVKVIRPELRVELKHDLKLISILSKFIAVFNTDAQVAISNAFKTFKKSTISETDYLNEATLAKSVADHLKDDPCIVIPHTYQDLCNDRMIVQEKLDGVWLSELLQLELNSEDAADFVKQKTGSDLESQLYYLGFKNLYDSLSGFTVHGDPHPGNVVLMTNNRVGLIDFGVMAGPVQNRLALLEYIKEQIRGNEGNIDVPRLMLSIVRFHASSLYRAIDSLSKYYKKPILAQLYDFLTEQVGASEVKVDESMVPTGQYSNMLSASINKDNRFGLLPKVDAPITQKAFITLWRTYDELGFQPLTFRVFGDVVKAIENDNDVSLWREPAMPLDVAIETIGEWLNLVAEKDAKLFMSLRHIMYGRTY